MVFSTCSPSYCNVGVCLRAVAPTRVPWKMSDLLAGLLFTELATVTNREEDTMRVGDG